VVRRSSLTGFPRPSSACRARSKVERHVVRRTDSVPTVHAVHRALEARRRDLSGAPARAHDLVRQCVTLSLHLSRDVLTRAPLFLDPLHLAARTLPPAPPSLSPCSPPRPSRPQSRPQLAARQCSSACPPRTTSSRATTTRTRRSRASSPTPSRAASAPSSGSACSLPLFCSFALLRLSIGGRRRARVPHDVQGRQLEKVDERALTLCPSAPHTATTTPTRGRTRPRSLSTGSSRARRRGWRAGRGRGAGASSSRSLLLPARPEVGLRGADLVLVSHRFWTALPFTFATVRASMKASKEPNAGVKQCVPRSLRFASYSGLSSPSPPPSLSQRHDDHLGRRGQRVRLVLRAAGHAVPGRERLHARRRGRRRAPAAQV